MTTSTAAALAVRFTLYAAPGLPLPLAAGRVAAALTVQLERRSGAVRGVYYRWSGDDAADVLVQANVADEEGELVAPGEAAGTPLVYVTGLEDAEHEALARVEGLWLLDRDVVTLG